MGRSGSRDRRIVRGLVAVLSMAAVSLASDRAFAHAYLVKDIKPGAPSSSPSRMVVLGTELLFFADDGVVGSELWKTDGTTSGTVLVKDINGAGLASSNVGLEKPVRVGSEIFFGTNALNGLYKSNGTTAGTAEVKSGITASNLVNANGRLYFTGNQLNTSLGTELWTSDGTTQGTFMLKDIALGSSSCMRGYSRDIVPLGTGAIFVADARGSIGEELWKTDGTADGTVL